MGEAISGLVHEKLRLYTQKSPALVGSLEFTQVDLDFSSCVRIKKAIKTNDWVIRDVTIEAL